MDALAIPGKLRILEHGLSLPPQILSSLTCPQTREPVWNQLADSTCNPIAEPLRLATVWLKYCEII